ncbi:hypothetical protein AV530_017332 [Patagioenas fasciata monilis]|uniref:Uncharacterized protein n=1 Tax=Patagioenas fasciata monilis TaxID=372326 RepID=A0A1V4JFQ1_PATFA|nr:hypothetical protein AV530_017332 [Patagioenas fasciata monilis]
MSYSVQLSSLDRKLCKRDRRETEVFREETVELEQEQEMTAAWLLSKDAFRHLASSLLCYLFGIYSIQTLPLACSHCACCHLTSS